MVCFENNINCSEKEKVPTASIPLLNDSNTDYYFIHYQGQLHSYSCYNITANADFGKRK